MLQSFKKLRTKIRRPKVKSLKVKIKKYLISNLLAFTIVSQVGSSIAPPIATNLLNTQQPTIHTLSVRGGYNNDESNTDYSRLVRSIKFKSDPNPFNSKQPWRNQSVNKKVDIVYRSSKKRTKRFKTRAKKGMSEGLDYTKKGFNKGIDYSKKGINNGVKFAKKEAIDWLNQPETKRYLFVKGLEIIRNMIFRSKNSNTNNKLITKSINNSIQNNPDDLVSSNPLNDDDKSRRSVFFAKAFTTNVINGRTPLTKLSNSGRNNNNFIDIINNNNKTVNNEAVNNETVVNKRKRGHIFKVNNLDLSSYQLHDKNVLRKHWIHLFSPEDEAKINIIRSQNYTEFEKSTLCFEKICEFLRSNNTQIKNNTKFRNETVQTWYDSESRKVLLFEQPTSKKRGVYITNYRLKPPAFNTFLKNNTIGLTSDQLQNNLIQSELKKQEQQLQKQKDKLQEQKNMWVYDNLPENARLDNEQLRKLGDGSNITDSKLLQRFQLNREKEPYLIKIANRIFTLETTNITEGEDKL